MTTECYILESKRKKFICFNTHMLKYANFSYIYEHNICEMKFYKPQPRTSKQSTLNKKVNNAFCSCPEWFPFITFIICIQVPYLWVSQYSSISTDQTALWQFIYLTKWAIYNDWLVQYNSIQYNSSKHTCTINIHTIHDLYLAC